jgi:hypothetical protein
LKTRLILPLSLAALAAASLWVMPSLLSLREVRFQTDRVTTEAKPVSMRTRADNLGVHRGDAFSYRVEVQYDAESVSEIDKASLEKSINLKPFEVRKVAEHEAETDSRTRTYVREYQLQLIDGKIDTLYKFPTIVLRYRVKESGTYEEKTIVPDPIFVASRLPPDTGSLDLRPIQDAIEDPGWSHLHWILMGLGGFLAILAIADLAWRALPQWRAAVKNKRRTEGVDVLSEAYRSLHAAAAGSAESGPLLYQVQHILRVILARKEKVGWMDEPDFGRIAPGIREEVVSLYSMCEDGSGSRSPEERRTQDAVAKIEKILAFYCGEGALRAWRR